MPYPTDHVIIALLPGVYHIRPVRPGRAAGVS